MAKIPLPERGQPLDVTYLYQVANAVNDLSSQISSTTYNYLTQDTPSLKQSVKTSESKIVVGYTEPATKSTVGAGNEKVFSFSYADFKYAPIVTATPINVGGTPAGKDVTVILTSVTKSGLTGIIKFNTAGDVTVGINLIIIGIPN